MRQAYPLDLKITLTIKRLREFCKQNDAQVYLALSGGKDSQVLAHIIRCAGLPIPFVFVNTFPNNIQRDMVSDRIRVDHSFWDNYLYIRKVACPTLCKYS